MSEITETIANVTMTGLALYGAYVMWQLHKVIKRAHRDLGKIEGETDR